MRSTAKNRKQRSSFLPIGIKWVVRITFVALGCAVWGTGFVFALAGFYLLRPVFRSLLLSFVKVGVILALLFILLAFL